MNKVLFCNAGEGEISSLLPNYTHERSNIDHLFTVKYSSTPPERIYGIRSNI